MASSHAKRQSARGTQLVDDAAEQAAAQGITVVAASGNTGAAGCEVQGTAGTATTGYAVNGYASSPYVTAVGGTDFYYSGAHHLLERCGSRAIARP